MRAGGGHACIEGKAGVRILAKIVLSLLRESSAYERTSQVVQTQHMIDRDRPSRAMKTSPSKRARQQRQVISHVLNGQQPSDTTAVHRSSMLIKVHYRPHKMARRRVCPIKRVCLFTGVLCRKTLLLLTIEGSTPAMGAMGGLIAPVWKPSCRRFSCLLASTRRGRLGFNPQPTQVVFLAQHRRQYSRSQY